MKACCRIILCLLFLPALAGCAGSSASEPMPVAGAQPDGSWAVACHGDDQDWNVCYREAETRCGGAYSIVRSLTRAEDGVPLRMLLVRCENAKADGR